MRAGILRHRVSIEAYGTALDSWGQPVEAWAAILTNLPAEVRDIRGREFWSGGQTPAGEVTTRVRIRYRDDVDLTRQMRVVHQGRVLPVETILDPDGKRTELHLMCQEAS